MLNATVVHLNIGLTMSFILQPWQLYVVVLSGWTNRQQQEAIEYLRTENQVLKEKLGKKHILLSNENDQHQGEIQCRRRIGGLLRYYHWATECFS